LGDRGEVEREGRGSLLAFITKRGKVQGTENLNGSEGRPVTIYSKKEEFPSGVGNEIKRKGGKI